MKRDLEAALKDVLQAMRLHQGTTPLDAVIDIPSLERLANVSISSGAKCDVSFLRLFLKGFRIS